ncbi:enoyl-CoA hydratase/isomerase family protein [Dactylosporangium sp. CA-092794]|uniref:enoyl-CoA hydratase/isomerase family protein n=1 Tax=Dactylosporangium sp. CA-092794 TaxID=3239929 RepID=UPI003D8D13C8
MIELEEHGAVQIVRLRHGKVNAMDLELLVALRETFERLRDAAAVVLTGSGGSFSAGVDLRRVLDGGHDYAAAFLPALNAACRAVFEHPRPVVAAVNGHAIAGGCILVAACDRRFMAGGTIGVSELAVGVPFPTVPLEILRFAAGPATAELVLTSRTMPPPEALAAGLVDEVVPPDELLGRALGEAERLSRLPAATFAVTKEQLRRDTIRRIEAGEPADAERVLAGWTSPEVRATIAGFLEALTTRRA